MINPVDDSIDSDPFPAGFDNAVEWIVAALLIFAPLAFGTTQPWSQEVFVIAVAFAAAVVAAKYTIAKFKSRRALRPVLTWIYLPMFAFLCLCVLQNRSLPAGLVNAVSPATIRLKSDLLSDIPDVKQELGRTTLSFYPFATHSQTVLLTAVVALFAVVVDVYRDPARIRRLLGVIAAVGLAVASLAAYQNISGATTVYGIVRAMHRNSGPFANYSHFSQFMNLSIGASLAVLLVGLTELNEYYRTPAEVWRAVRRPQHAILWIAALTCVLGPITIFLCMSRMGMISMLVAMVVTSAMLLWQGSSGKGGGRGGRGSLLAIVGLLVFVALLYVGFDTVYARLATVGDFESSAGIRTRIVRDLLPLFRQFPVLGTGLGTHEFIYPVFDRLDVPRMASHAENEYAQLMEESGGVGVLLAASFIGWMLVQYVRSTRRPREPIAYAAFGLGFGLFAILLHSFSDFGQHVPANAALTAIFAALLLNFARRARSELTSSEPPPTTNDMADQRRDIFGILLRPMVVVAVIVAGTYAVISTDRSRRAEANFTQAKISSIDLEAANWQAGDSVYLAIITSAARAALLEPTNITYRYWNDVYRWHALAHDLDPATGSVRLSTAAVPFAIEIVADLEAARLQCPSFGPPLCVAGQINYTVLGHRDLGRDEIHKAVRITPYDKDVNYAAARLAVDENDWSTAQSAFARYTLLGGNLHDFTDLLLHAGHPEIPYAIARGSRDNLRYLVSRMPQDDPAWKAWIARCTSDADTLLMAEATGPSASPDSLAQLATTHARQNHPLEAIPLFQRALRDNYARTDWRLALARCELAAGKPKDAARDARVVLQLRPASVDAQEIIDTAERTGL